MYLTLLGAVITRSCNCVYLSNCGTNEGLATVQASLTRTTGLAVRLEPNPYRP